VRGRAGCYNLDMKPPAARRAPTAEPGLREKAQLMSSSEIDRTLVRLAHEIVERNNGAPSLVLVGVRRRGFPLAERLAKKIADIEKVRPPVGMIDITFYRDDRSRGAQEARVQETSIPFSIEDKTVILVDDVLYTGRSTRAALDALVDHGRPLRVELCVLIDRGHRELPIQANYVGRVVQTAAEESVEVHLHEVDDEDRVILCEKG
jgi:pyrimidine operon attenuation protein/uracil phosphoribosyltransferase